MTDREDGEEGNEQDEGGRGTLRGIGWDGRMDGLTEVGKEEGVGGGVEDSERSSSQSRRQHP